MAPKSGIVVWRLPEYASGRQSATAATVFSPLQSLPFDDGCAEHYALIRADLAAQGKPIGPNDWLIAAIARAHDVTLITPNTAEYRRG